MSVGREVCQQTLLTSKLQGVENHQVWGGEGYHLLADTATTRITDGHWRGWDISDPRHWPAVLGTEPAGLRATLG